MGVSDSFVWGVAYRVLVFILFLIDLWPKNIVFLVHRG